MSKFNTVWVTGTPRTGSMWTTNVIRELYLTKRYALHPQEQLQYEREWLNLFRDHAIADTSANSRYVLKIHTLLNPNLPKSKFVVNTRNPYDICASFFDFTKCDLDRAIEVALNHRSVMEHYNSFRSGLLFVVKYEDLELDTINLILALSEFIECGISKAMARVISSKYNKRAIKKLIKRTESEVQRKIREKDYVHNKMVVGRADGSFRSFDLDTGFQSGHISRRNSGEWRNSFSQKQIAVVISALDGLVADMGYMSER